MNPIAEILIEQVSYARKLGQRILEVSGLNDDGVIYAFATPDTLVINCSDYQTTWRLEEEQLKLRLAIAKLKYSIQTIAIERAGKTLYFW
ncbi:hypothetical protein ACE1CI_15930 [Aerosakkonemataceae cyanobacterium BLCC-F50]|uniref:Uncharacterized protein n=1 Tax=Floridaenema flaviceps BLCC-F50 TaxID=3153642 RepID=A0ABV4XRS8_9CYAN